MGRNRRRQRDVTTTSTPSLTSLLSVARPPSSPLLSPLTEALSSPMLDDRRTYHPLGPQRPAVYSSGPQSDITLRDKSYGGRPRVPMSSGTKAAQVFGSPDATTICIRRHRRKEVLFAKRQAGRRGRKQRPRRRNWHSNIGC